MIILDLVRTHRIASAYYWHVQWKMVITGWLHALPIQEQDFYLNEQEFQDTLRLMYGWELARIPSHCVCGASFSVNHAMIYCHGGLTFICHNDLRNLTASWLHEVCHDVVVEPPLQPLTGEALVPASANRRNDARADIHARGFWDRRQGAFVILECFIPTHLAITRLR